MPVTPQQVLSNRQDRLKDKVDATCRVIDEKLNSHYEGNGRPVCIDRTLITADILDTVKSIYSQHGWDISWGKDGRGDIWYEFKPTVTAKVIEDYYNK